MDNSEKLLWKDASTIARICGLSESLVKGLSWQDFNKEGAIQTAKEIAELANNLLDRIQKRLG